MRNNPDDVTVMSMGYLILYLILHLEHFNITSAEKEKKNEHVGFREVYSIKVHLSKCRSASAAWHKPENKCQTNSPFPLLHRLFIFQSVCKVYVNCWKIIRYLHEHIRMHRKTPSFIPLTVHLNVEWLQCFDVSVNGNKKDPLKTIHHLNPVPLTPLPLASDNADVLHERGSVRARLWE